MVRGLGFGVWGDQVHGVQASDCLGAVFSAEPTERVKSQLSAASTEKQGPGIQQRTLMPIVAGTWLMETLIF